MPSWLLVVLCLAPLGLLIFDLASGRLSANPIDDITDRTGIWALRMLLLALTVTPVRRLTGWATLAAWRRTLGLFGFFYACLHFLTFLVLDHFFDWQSVLADIAKRPYVTVGFTSLVILIPLAVTSTKRIARVIGGRRWKQLHRLAYVAAAGGVVHYLWLVKIDTSRPLAYGAILAVLMALRVWFWLGDYSRTSSRLSS